MRVCILGIDGLTFDVLDPMIEAGYLPNFKRLKAQGAWGVLRSTIPPYTPPAWMSIATGVKPAQHGVFDFWELSWVSGRLEAELVTRRKAGRALWEILSEYGRRVIVVNVPCTYPPDPVNGVMVSGFSAPSLESPFTYPTAFREELLRRVPDYAIDVQILQDLTVGNDDYKLEAVQRMTDARIRLLESFLSETGWDFMFFTFVGADRLQHPFWKEVTSFSQPQAIAYYEQIDRALGMVLDSLSSADWLLLLSDHGFQGADHLIDLNLILAEAGLAQLSLKSHLVTVGANIGQALGIKKFLRRMFTPMLQKDWFAAVGANVDLAASRCVAVNGDGFGLVYSRDRLDDATLKALADRIADSGVAEWSNILWSEALAAEIGGDFSVNGAPQLAVVSRRGWSFRPGIGRDGRASHISVRGVHDMSGVLLLSGPGLASGKFDGASVYDIAPSVLHLFGLPQESQFDGKLLDVLSNATRGSTLLRDARTGAVWDTTSASNPVLADRLRRLADPDT